MKIRGSRWPSHSWRESPASQNAAAPGQGQGGCGLHQAPAPRGQARTLSKWSLKGMYHKR